ncbi:MAG TPA: isoprenylcysteine carboxylmethyltransferase family protein [Thermoanaerobaculia bacterium]|jgi:protein-S-isoprenylcysteine O-methyltransferase Ste14
METFRYVLGVLTLMGLPPALAYWYIVHPFVGFWRRRGTAVTFTFLAVVYLAMSAGLFLVRDRLLLGDLGTDWVLVAVSLPLLGLAIAIQFKRRRLLTFKVLAGIPEVAPEKHGSKLLTEGIYGKLRHPRYVEFTAGGLGYALIINYAAIYVLMVLTILALVPIVIFEERELHERFGAAYDEYRARVPAFFPRF